MARIDKPQNRVMGIRAGENVSKHRQRRSRAHLSTALQHRLGVFVRILRCMPYLLASTISLLGAWILGLPGIRFGWFGIAAGFRCLFGWQAGMGSELLSCPVSTLRYLEFGCAFKLLAPFYGRCLDVSSPRLFSTYVLKETSVDELDIINADRRDMGVTLDVLANVGVESSRYHGTVARAESLPWPDCTFSCVWSISVIEHVPEPDDVAAMREIWRVVKPGGTLYITVPTSKEATEEARSEDVYQVLGDEGRAPSSGDVFFQRLYDRRQVEQKLLGPLEGVGSVRQTLYGESSAGLYDTYEKKWKELGPRCTCWDPLWVAFRFRRYKSIDALDGLGILCLAITKDVKAAGTE